MTTLRELTRFYGLFAIRHVLNHGALRNAYTRISLLLTALLWLAFSFVAPFLLFNGVAFTSAEQGLLEVLLSFNTLVWIELAFLVVKTLFLTAEGIEEYTAFLPVTNRQRSQALLAFELIAITVIVFYGTCGMTVWTMSQLGAQGLRVVLITTFLPALAAYAFLSLGWNSLVSLVSLTPAKRGAPLIANLALTIPVYATLTSQQAAGTHITSRFEAAGRSFFWLTAIADSAFFYGLVPTVAGSVAFIALCLAASFAIAPKRAIRTSSFFPLPVPRLLSPGLAVHLAYAFRSRYTWDTFAVALVLALWLHGNSLPPTLAIGTLCITGLYMYGGNRVRAWELLTRPSPLRHYILLVSALALTAGTLSIPVVAAGFLFHVLSLTDVFVAIASALSGAVLFTLVGVVFPARRDNPFSAFAGLGSLLLSALFLAVTFNLLGLATRGLAIAAFATLVAIMAMSIAAIATTQRKERRGAS